MAQEHPSIWAQQVTMLQEVVNFLFEGTSCSKAPPSVLGDASKTSAPDALARPRRIMARWMPTNV
jgi:hypothetical protein